MPRKRTDDISTLLYQQNFAKKPACCDSIDGRHLLSPLEAAFPGSTHADLLSPSHIGFISEIENGNWEHFGIVFRQMLRIIALTAFQSENPETLHYGTLIFLHIWGLDDDLYVHYFPCSLKEFLNDIRKDPHQITLIKENYISVMENHHSKLLDGLIKSSIFPKYNQLSIGSTQAVNNYINGFITYAIPFLPFEQNVGGNTQNVISEQNQTISNIQGVEGGLPTSPILGEKERNLLEQPLAKQEKDLKEEEVKNTGKEADGKAQKAPFLGERERQLFEKILRSTSTQMEILDLPCTQQMLEKITLRPFNTKPHLWFTGRRNLAREMPPGFYSESRMKRKVSEKEQPQYGIEEDFYRIDLIDLLLLEPRLLIIGGFGTGKTTLLKHLISTIASGSLENPDTGILPIYIDVQGLEKRHIARLFAEQVATQWLDDNIDPAATKEDYLGIIKLFLDADKVIWVLDHFPVNSDGTVPLIGDALRDEIPPTNPMIVCPINPNRLIIQSLQNRFHISENILTMQCWTEGQAELFFNIYRTQCRAGLVCDETLAFFTSLEPKPPEAPSNISDARRWGLNKRLREEADRRLSIDCMEMVKNPIQKGQHPITPLNVINHCIAMENLRSGMENVCQLSLIKKLADEGFPSLFWPIYSETRLADKENVTLLLLLDIVRKYYNWTKSADGQVPLSGGQYILWIGEDHSVNPEDFLTDLIQRQILAREYSGKGFFFSDPHDFQLLYASGWLRRNHRIKPAPREVIPSEEIREYIEYLFRSECYEEEYLSLQETMKAALPVGETADVIG